VYDVNMSRLSKSRTTICAKDMTDGEINLVPGVNVEELNELM
jgi:hypothetical protein